MLSREELYRLVWSEPMTKVAKRFDVSGSYLARVCSMLNVPRPERGYWAKLASGKTTKRATLPLARPGDPLSWSKEGDVPPVNTPRTPPLRDAKKVPRIPRRVVHGLIKGMVPFYEKTRPVGDDGYLKPYKQLLADIVTSPSGLQTALDFANDLYNAFESLGYCVVIAPSGDRLHRPVIDEREIPDKRRERYDHYTRGWRPYRSTVVCCGSIYVGISIVEMSEDILFRYHNGKYIKESEFKSGRQVSSFSWTTIKSVPSGRLRLVAYSPYYPVEWSMRWQDTKDASLRSQIKKIVLEIEQAAIGLVHKLDEADRQAEIDKQKRLIAEDVRKRLDDNKRVEQSVKESQEHLRHIINQWNMIISIENFLQSVERKIETLSKSEALPVVERLKLAREFLGSQDPMEFFLSWKTPAERYKPIYSENAFSPVNDEGDVCKCDPNKVEDDRDGWSEDLDSDD